jgi:hypothetical protein
MNNHLLHAAARGARIQALDRNLGWIISSHAPLELSNDKRPYRLHPDDEHLAYGPISTALREAAETGEFPYTLAGLLTKIALDYESMYTYVTYNWHITYLLILAEALADEGL